MKRKLTKSHNKKIAGVAGGLAEYFGIDSSAVRLAWVIATVFSIGSAIPVYIILAILMPKSDNHHTRRYRSRQKSKQFGNKRSAPRQARVDDDEFADF